jgi:hypothetical protein
MKVAEIKTRLHDQIEQSDERLLKMVYALMQEHGQEKTEDLDNARRKLIQAERESYLAGEGKSYSWDEVKNMAINRKAI